MQKDRINVDSTSPKRLFDLNALSKQQFVHVCYAVSFISAYFAAAALSFPLAAWEFADAQSVKDRVLSLPFRPVERPDESFLGLLFGLFLWILPLLICLGISAFWVEPLSRLPQLTRRARLAAVTIAASLASTGLFLCLSLAYTSSHGKPVSRNSCANNLRQLGLVFRLYASENTQNVFPELSIRRGSLSVREGTLIPEYVSDISIFRCPSWTQDKKWYQPPPSAISTIEDDQSYFYLGYQIANQSDLLKFETAYQRHFSTKENFDKDLPLEPNNTSGTVLPRLRYDSSMPSPSIIPVLIERYPNRHPDGSGRVLYADGHVEFIKWGEKWPMTPEAMDVLLSLDAMGAANSSAE